MLRVSGFQPFNLKALAAPRVGVAWCEGRKQTLGIRGLLEDVGEFSQPLS